MSVLTSADVGVGVDVGVFATVSFGKRVACHLDCVTRSGREQRTRSPSFGLFGIVRMQLCARTQIRTQIRIQTPEFVVNPPPGEPRILALTRGGGGYNDLGITNKTSVKNVSARFARRILLSTRGVY